MSTDQIRAIWNISEVIIEELVTAAEGLKGASGDDKQRFVEEKALQAVTAIIDNQHIVSGVTRSIVLQGVQWALHLVIARVWARVAPHSTPAAKAA